MHPLFNTKTDVTIFYEIVAIVTFSSARPEKHSGG